MVDTAERLLDRDLEASDDARGRRLSRVARIGIASRHPCISVAGAWVSLQGSEYRVTTRSRRAWGAETRSSRCRGDVVLVDDAAEQVAAGHLKTLRFRLRSNA